MSAADYRVLASSGRMAPIPCPFHCRFGIFDRGKEPQGKGECILKGLAGRLRRPASPFTLVGKHMAMRRIKMNGPKFARMTIV
jgi:hypothetical protein